MLNSHSSMRLKYRVGGNSWITFEKAKPLPIREPKIIPIGVEILAKRYAEKRDLWTNEPLTCEQI